MPFITPTAHDINLADTFIQTDLQVRQIKAYDQNWSSFSQKCFTTVWNHVNKLVIYYFNILLSTSVRTVVLRMLSETFRILSTNVLSHVDSFSVNSDSRFSACFPRHTFRILSMNSALPRCVRRRRGWAHTLRWRSSSLWTTWTRPTTSRSWPSSRCRSWSSRPWWMSSPGWVQSPAG